MHNQKEVEKELAAREAVKLIKDNQIVGLGTGSSTFYAIKAIGEMVRDGLKIQGVPTSEESRKLAESLNIPLIDISDVDAIDITIDGADEFTSELMLIKGGGGALLKEKVVASLTNMEIIITDSSKQVDLLGKFTLPIEVIPYAVNFILQQLKKINGTGKIRMKSDKIFITEEGNYIIDGDFGLIEDPLYLASELNKITGVVEHGLFLNLTNKVIMGNGDRTITFNS